MDPSCGNSPDNVRLEDNTILTSTTNLQADVGIMKQEEETTLISQAAKNVENDVPNVTVEIKQEVFDEEHSERERELSEEVEDVECVRKKRITNMSYSYPPEDKYCEDCKQEYEEGCPLHGSLAYIDTTELHPGSTSTDGLETKINQVDSLDICKAVKLKVRQVVPCTGCTDKGSYIAARKKPYKCDVCGVCVISPSHLRNHKRVHTGERPFKCTVCPAVFKCRDSLKKHERIHTGERPFKCDVCGLGFIEKSVLKDHYRTHTGEKPYKCDVCGLQFPRKNALLIHIRRHTEEMPFKCDVCNLRYSTFSALNYHKRIHTEEKPYKCNVCDAGYSVKGSLTRHLKIHAEKKPFKCDVCGDKFSDNPSLTSHKISHAEKKSHKFDVCART